MPQYLETGLIAIAPPGVVFGELLRRLEGHDDDAVLQEVVRIGFPGLLRWELQKLQKLWGRWDMKSRYVGIAKEKTDGAIRRATVGPGTRQL